VISIDELERLEKAATPGPWRFGLETETDEMARAIVIGRYVVSDAPGKTRNVMDSFEEVEFSNFKVTHASASDMEFCAAARNALPALIAEVRELRAYKAQVERVKACGACLRGTVLNDFGVPRGGCDKCGGLP